MTGTVIYDIRGMLGMTNEQFAALIGVDTRTVYRWEVRGDLEATRMNIRAEQVLTILLQMLTPVPSTEREKFGAYLKETMAVRSSLAALHVVLDLVYGDGAKKVSSARLQKTFIELMNGLKI